MFDIGFQELLLIGVLSLLIMGPERLPGAIRTASLWLGRLRSSFQQIKTEIEREVGADEIKRQLHNEALLKSLEQAKSELNDTAHSIKPEIEKLEHDVNAAVNSSHTEKDETTTHHD
jgi:sec-independent protein translocase protein TatB